MPRGTAVVPTLVVIAMAAAIVPPAAASPQPTPVCPVCGQTFHENVTATDATLQVQGDGDVRWHVENELADPTASRWRENGAAARVRVEEELTRSFGPPYDPESLEVSVEGDTLVVGFVDRSAARQRLGVLVLPYLHGEGVQARYVVNADEFVVEGPAGHRVVNEPAGATVEDGRAVWRGVAAGDERMDGGELWTAPEPGDTYVVFGSGGTAEARSILVTGLEPLDPGLYGRYLLGLLVVAGLTAGGYALHRRRVERRVERRLVAGGVALAILPYLYLVARLHPPPTGGLGGFFLRLLAVGATVFIGLTGGFLLWAWATITEPRDERAT